eukprot:355798-Chlamydomonas_euryale.AAC.1
MKGTAKKGAGKMASLGATLCPEAPWKKTRWHRQAHRVPVILCHQYAPTSCPPPLITVTETLSPPSTQYIRCLHGVLCAAQYAGDDMQTPAGVKYIVLREDDILCKA